MAYNISVQSTTLFIGICLFMLGRKARIPVDHVVLYSLSDDQKVDVMWLNSV